MGDGRGREVDLTCCQCGISFVAVEVRGVSYAPHQLCYSCHEVEGWGVSRDPDGSWWLVHDSNARQPRRLSPEHGGDFEGNDGGPLPTHGADKSMSGGESDG